MKKFFSSVFDAVGTIITGGKFGSTAASPHSYAYSKAQEQRRRDFEQYGGHPCRICNTRIPCNKSYCGPCYFTYKK